VEQGPGLITGQQNEQLPVQNNPATGAVQALAIDPTNPNVVYAGTVGGGVWKTANATDASPTWQPLTDQQLPFLDINSLAVSPVNPNEIFAGSGLTTAFQGKGGPSGFGVGRSLDGGLTWQVLGAGVLGGQSIRSIVPTTLDGGNVVLAASLYANNLFFLPPPQPGGGVYRSADGGVTWTQLSGAAHSGLPAESVSDLVADPGNPRRFYAAVAPFVFGSTGQEGVYRSDDGGLTWAPVNNGLAGLGTSPRILLAVHNSPAGNAVYAMVINRDGTLGGIFRSANQGADWTPMGTPAVDIFQQGQGMYPHGAIVADPHDPNVVYISGDGDDESTAGAFEVGTIVRGDAAQPPGAVWTRTYLDGANNTSPHPDSRALAFDDNGNLLEASDGGIARLSHPNDATVRQWQYVSNNLSDVEFHSVAYDPLSRVVLGGTQDNGTPVQTQPGAALWDDSLTVPGDGGVVAVDADQRAHPGTSIRYTSGQYLNQFNRSTWDANNNLLGTTFLGLNIVAGPGAGQNLFDFDPFVQFSNPLVLNAVDPRRLLIGTQTLYESFDQGDSLRNLGFSNGQYVGASPNPVGGFMNQTGVPLVYGGHLGAVANPDVIWAGVGDQIVYREHLGDPLQAVKGYRGGLVETIVADPQNYRHLFVCDDSNQVWYSADAGHSFRNLTADLPQVGGIVLTLEVARTGPLPTDVALVAGALNGVFARDLAGSGPHVWHRLGNNLPNVMVDDLHYYPEQRLLLAGTLGRGAWTLTNPFDRGDSSDPDTTPQAPLERAPASQVPGVAAGTLAKVAIPGAESPHGLLGLTGGDALLIAADAARRVGPAGPTPGNPGEEGGRDLPAGRDPETGQVGGYPRPAEGMPGAPLAPRGRRRRSASGLRVGPADGGWLEVANAVPEVRALTNEGPGE
jgi:hypothetical protein